MPDHGAINVALAGVVANYATGDPVWPLLVGPPGCGKSEIVSALVGAPDVWPLSSLTPQTLLSGFERKDKPASLLLQIGEFGIIVCKDFGSVLSMNRDARAALLAGLREVYDGSWTRHVGTDGGRTLHWAGKVGLIAGCTPAIDQHHRGRDGRSAGAPAVADDGDAHRPTLIQANCTCNGRAGNLRVLNHRGTATQRRRCEVGKDTQAETDAQAYFLCASVSLWFYRPFSNSKLSSTSRTIPSASYPTARVTGLKAPPSSGTPISAPSTPAPKPH